MRSNTTSMSSERGWNRARRCASTNLGFFRCGRAAVSAGLKRSTCPTWSTIPAPDAAASMASASSRDAAIGFSTSACRPAEAARSRAARWPAVGTAMDTASQAASRASGVGNAAHP